MAASIPAGFEDLFRRKAFGHLATLMPDGRPQATPVWVDFDGKHVLLNTAEGRRKLANLRRDPRVAISIIDPENPYRYLEVRGQVAGITHEGADEHIDQLARRYLGKDRYPWRRAGEQRVLVRIEPEHTTARA